MPDILVVEDNKSDIFLIREALQTARVVANVHVVMDGDGVPGSSMQRTPTRMHRARHSCCWTEISRSGMATSSWPTCDKVRAVEPRG